MTRAKDQLHLIVPQRFYTHGQPSRGHRHVYVQPTRFIPDAILQQFEACSWPMAESASGSEVGPKRAPIDVLASSWGAHGAAIR
jgi:DNA helicase-2/ATP-dependent DNA helicase PcrA